MTLDGNPCYGACDLSREASGDILVHIGHTPLGRGDDERVIYMPLSQDADLAVLSAALPLLERRIVGLVSTAQHAHLLPEAAAFLEARGFEARIGGPTPRTPLRGQVLGCSYGAARETGAPEILFVGTGLFHPLGVALATGARVIAADPFTGQVEVADPGRLLRQRFARIERAKGAATVGILLSTKTGQRRAVLARKLASLDPSRSVVIALEEVTPDALVNLGFDAYVNTACPRLAYDDSMRFPAPVLAPPEYEIALGRRAWEEYVLDECG